MTEAYRLTESHTLGDSTYEEGLTVYRCGKSDYGTARTDSMMTGIEHLSMSLDPEGDYPFFTVPVNKLESISAQRKEARA